MPCVSSCFWDLERVRPHARDDLKTETSWCRASCGDLWRPVAAQRRRTRPLRRPAVWDADLSEQRSCVYPRSLVAVCGLQRLDVRRGRALGTLLGVVTHLRALSQRLEAVALDRAV